MLNNKRILVVVPARGGSKGIKLKNLRQIAGLPMVAHTANIITQLTMIDRAVVSTDHEQIAKVAEQYGLAAPFRRPQELSGDRISDWDVLVHALISMEEKDATRYDIVVMLQPTSPLRTAHDVQLTIEKLIREKLDAVWTVSETDSKGHPLKQLTIKNNLLDYYDPAGAAIIARQQLTPVYHRNGVAYAISRDCLLQQRTIKGMNTGALIIKELNVSVDTEEDIQLVEQLLKQRECEVTT